MRKDGQPEQPGPQVSGRQFSSVPPAGSPASPVLQGASAIFAPKLEFAGNALSVLSKRIAAMEQTGTSTPLRNRLQLLETQFRKTGDNLDGAAGPTDPVQLLKLQHDIYQIDEELELLSKVVEQTTSGIKSVLQIQI